MKEQENPLNYLFVEEEPINYRELLGKYLYYWKWFALGALVALAAAFLYLRYTPNTYLVKTAIFIDDEAAGGLPSELSAFEDLGLMGGAKKKIENEIGLLKSRSLMLDVVKELKLNVGYYKKGRVREVELYKSSVPFKINFLTKDSLFYKRDTSFSIQGISATKYFLKNSEGVPSKEIVFGEKVTTDFGDFTITPTALNNVNLTDEIIVTVTPLTTVAEGLMENVSVELLYKKSTLIELRLKSTLKLKAMDILNRMVLNYNKEAVEDKNLIGYNTEAFINERLSVIKNDL